MTKPIFYEGQQVGCLMYGEGIITSFLSEDKNSFYVKFNHTKGVYYKNGKCEDFARPTLYPIEQYRAIIANLPAPEPEKWQPKPGEWCWFWNNYNSNAAVIAKFVEVLGTKYMAEISGDLVDYPNCAPFKGELPEHLKEVQL